LYPTCSCAFSSVIYDSFVVGGKTRRAGAIERASGPVEPSFDSPDRHIELIDATVLDLRFDVRDFALDLQVRPQKK